MSLAATFSFLASLDLFTPVTVCLDYTLNNSVREVAALPRRPRSLQLSIAGSFLVYVSPFLFPLLSSYHQVEQQNRVIDPSHALHNHFVRETVDLAFIFFVLSSDL